MLSRGIEALPRPTGFRRRRESKKAFPIFSQTRQGVRASSGVPAIRKIRGFRYQLAMSYEKAEDARKYADACHSAGWRASVVPANGQWHVYLRGADVHRHSSEGGTLFFPAEHKKYEDIVTYKSPEAADAAAKALKHEFESAETRAKKVRVKRVTVLAANRAEATLAKKSLKPSTRVKLRKVAKEYREQAGGMKLPAKEVKSRG